MARLILEPQSVVMEGRQLEFSRSDIPKNFSAIKSILSDIAWAVWEPIIKYTFYNNY